MPRSPEPARQALIRAATDIFAERGIDAATVAEVVAAAGQRNVSAVNYHFGGKEGLLEAVLSQFAPAIDEWRASVLDAVDDEAPDGLAAAARALVLPLVQLLDREGGAAYLRIQAQLLARGERSQRVVRPVTRRLLGAAAGTGRAARHRGELVTSLVFHGLADFARRRPTATSAEREEFGMTMVAAVEAILRLDSHGVAVAADRGSVATR